jgi:hypothetical protein
VPFAVQIMPSALAELKAITAENDDDSTSFTQSAEFWQMIRERRQEQGISWEEARKELGLDREETGA